MTLEAERAVIGAALMDPCVVDMVALRPEHFGYALASKAWGIIGTLRDEGKSIDPLSVGDRSNIPEMTAFLSGCYVECLTADHADAHAEIIRRDWLTRRVLAAAASLGDSARRGAEGEELLGEALSAFSGLSISATGARPVRDLVRDRVRQHFLIQDAIARGEAPMTGVPSGIAALDELLGGIPKGKITTVGARPGMGKSALGLTAAMACVRAGIGAHVFSLEDTRETYIDRVLSRRSRISVEDLSAGRRLQRLDQRALSDAGTEISKMDGWLLDDRGGIDAAEICRSVRRHRRDISTGLVVVDYIQLLLKRDTRQKMHEHISAEMTTLADMAKAEGVAVLVMSQLNRGLEQREDKTPRMSDFKESGGLEERTKGAMIGLLRPWVYDRDADPGEIILAVLKNSQGQIGTVGARFDGPRIDIY